MYERTVFTHLLYYLKEIFPLYIYFRIRNFRKFFTHPIISIEQKLPDIQYTCSVTDFVTIERSTFTPAVGKKIPFTEADRIGTCIFQSLCANTMPDGIQLLFQHSKFSSANIFVFFIFVVGLTNKDILPTRIFGFRAHV